MENNKENSAPSKPPQKQGGFGRFSWLKNKYLLAGSFFIVWMFFFDPKDWGVAFEKNAKLKDLQTSELHLSNTIIETRKELDQLKTNAHTIEKYAREKYLMKKDNEDLFIVSSSTVTK